MNPAAKDDEPRRLGNSGERPASDRALLTRGPKIRVLVVDDEASVRITLVANLELEGFIVTEAVDGQEAITCLESETFDVVLSDIRMPRMNGLELLREAKKSWPDVPIILMTAFAAPGIERDAINEGAFVVLSKPFAIEDVVIALCAAVRLRATLATR